MIKYKEISRHSFWAKKNSVEMIHKKQSSSNPKVISIEPERATRNLKKQLKKWRREKKNKLIEEFNPNLKFLDDKI